MQDVRQSPLYAKYMEKIGWVVEEIDNVKVFIKKFPFVGSFIKIQRQGQALSVKQIDKLAKKYRAWRVSLEYSTSRESFGHPRGVPEGLLGGVLGFKLNNNPYLPTKTIQIDLTGNEEEIFQRFTEAKRRAVKKAIKNNIVVRESNNIEEFIKLKAKDFWPLSFFMAKDVRALWECLRPENATVILGIRQLAETPESKTDSGQARMTLVAGVLLLFYDNTAYYWMVASSSEGKKLFAPTLLVWEALKLAKKKGCKIFDFEGIYDPRFHKATKKWQGFTKFKEGFGGKEIIFPEPRIKNYRAF